MKAIKSCQAVSNSAEGGNEGSVFPDGANMRSRSVTDCCQVRISRFHRLFDRDQTEEEEGQNDARRGEERRGLSYQFLLPSITFNGDVSVSERTGRKEERRERGRLDMCEKEIRRR